MLMAHQKQPFGRGGYKGGPNGNRRGLLTSHSPFGRSFGRGFFHKSSQNGFTLEDEATSTIRNKAVWNSDQKLRHSKINFISAGALESTKTKNSTKIFKNMTIKSPGKSEAPESSNFHCSTFGINRLKDQASSMVLSTPSFHIDTHGTMPVETELSSTHLRSASPSPSNSSEEIIIFKGRNYFKSEAITASENNGILGTSLETKMSAVADKTQEPKELSIKDLNYSSKALVTVTTQGSSNDPQYESQNLHHRSTSMTSNKTESKTMLDEDSMASYMENIDSLDHNALISFSKRDIGGSSDNDFNNIRELTDRSQQIGSIGRTSESKYMQNCGGVNSSNDDTSKSPGKFVGGNKISNIKRNFSRQSQHFHQIKRVSISSLMSDFSISNNHHFEIKNKHEADHLGKSTPEQFLSDNTSIFEEDDSDDEYIRQLFTDSERDENTSGKMAMQNKEPMASKQISHNLKLFTDETETLNLSNKISNPCLSSSKKKKKKDKKKKKKNSRIQAGDKILAAGYIYDDFNDFELNNSDFSSPKRCKGRKGATNFNFPNPKIEDYMNMAWHNNRSKKTQKKKQREESRAHGLLGSNNGKTNMHAKYKDGINIYAFKQEMKAFLKSNDATFALPPMHKSDRKIVHEIAHSFKLKSQSIGNGHKRFPILYRTIYTSVFTEDPFNLIEIKLGRQKLLGSNHETKKIISKSNLKSPVTGKAVVSYRDGDVVGASAPELGVENRGRAMLEKMGWSSGTALGAINNKGILQPVSHVVKTSKAGLG